MARVHTTAIHCAIGIETDGQIRHSTLLYPELV